MSNKLLKKPGWATIPYLAKRYQAAHDKILHDGSKYYDESIISTSSTGDVVVYPVRSNRKIVDSEDEIDPEIFLSRSYISEIAYTNQCGQDKGILFERHNKGIPMLHILDVKQQYGSEDPVEYSWKLDEATKECILETNKKTVKFSFDTSDTDKLLFKVVDGYEVKYMLHTDAIRLRLQLALLSPPPNTLPDIHGEVKLEVGRYGKHYTINLLPDGPPMKKPKLDNSNNVFELSFILVVPRDLRSSMNLTLKLYDSTRTLDIDTLHRIFSYTLPVDQQDHIYFKNGCIRLNVFWGCCLRKGKGLCSGVCTCEPGQFNCFCNPGGEVGCSKINEE